MRLWLQLYISRLKGLSQLVWSLEHQNCKWNQLDLLMVITSENIVSFKLQVSCHTLKKNQNNLETKVTPVTEPHSSSEIFPKERFRGHKTWFLNGWMTSQIPFTYAEKKPLYSILTFKKCRFFFFLFISESGHPSLLLHVLGQEKQRLERIYPERGTEGGEVRPGRFDLFTLWHPNQLQIQEDTQKWKTLRKALSIDYLRK